MGNRLLFISNLFPDAAQAYRGLDNATVLHALKDRWQIRVLALRPSLPWQRKQIVLRPMDAALSPEFVRVPYVPKVGDTINPALMRASLAPHLRLSECDLVLVSWIFPDTCATLAAVDGRVPVVAIAQGSDVHQYLSMPARRREILRRLPEASAVITRSADLARRLQEAGIAAERLHPVYNGIDQDRFQRRADFGAEARQRLGIPNATPIILFVGNLLPIKNPALLLRAHAALADNSVLVLVGGGPLEAELRALSAALKTSNRVVFAGRQTPDQVADSMRSAQVLCLPSWNEGVPNVILEAFGCGLPVIASAVGGIAEVHPNKPPFGELVAAGDQDALCGALRRIMAAKADPETVAAHARQFTWERAGAEYDALLRGAQELSPPRAH